jgi:hypothetical protein
MSNALTSPYALTRYTLLAGLSLVGVAWLLSFPFSFVFAVFCGALVSTLNLHLTLWSWTPVFLSPPPTPPSPPLATAEPEEPTQDLDEAGETEEKRLPAVALPLWRFFWKYLFLFVGLFLILQGLQLHPLGFVLGLCAVVLAALFSPLLLPS